MTYATEEDIEGIIGYSIETTNSRPNRTELNVMLIMADSIVNAELKYLTNIDDDYGILRTICIGLVMKMINNLFFLAEPDNYTHMEIGLTDDERRLIRLSNSAWSAESWQLGD